MRYLSLLALFALAVVGCSRPTPPPPTPWMPDPTLSKDVREVDSESIVFLGDSLTHIGWWRKWFPDEPTANQGVGGNTTAMVLSRLDPIIDAQPAKVFVLIGANDLNYGVPHPLITAGQREIIQRIRDGSPTTEIFVQSVFPFGEDVRVYFPSVSESYVADIQAINAALVLVCADIGVQYLDVHNDVMVGPDGRLRPEFTDDQVHLSRAGYAAWVSYLEPYVTD